MEDNQQESFLQMHLDYDGGRILHETVRWSRFLSIVGIIGLSICVLAFALAGTGLLEELSRLAPVIEVLGAFAGAIVIVIVLVFLAVFGFIVYMLYRFSVLTRKGIDQRNQAIFAEGMKCLKVYFVISGIFALLGLLSNLFSLTKLFHS
jgi:predicted lysophospholipase L1 biosynthesis ABC-type transport system permease subunit